MAVSHKTNNLINCSRCHLPFNFKNAVPNPLPCKHWYCLNCLENLIHKNKDSEQIFCIQCQKSIDLPGLKQQQQQQNNNIDNFIKTQYKSKPQLLQSIINGSNSNSNNNNTTSFGCDEEYGLKDFDTVDNTNTATRSASLASDNSIGSLLYFNNDTGMEGNFNLMANCTSVAANGHNGGGGGGVGLEKMSPGENCFIHGMPNTLWCNTCMIVLCRGCNSGNEHKDHKVNNQLEAKECYQQHIRQEFLQIQDTLGDVENLKLLQKDFLLKILETCSSLKLQIENELVATATNTNDIDEMKETLKNLQLCLELLGKQSPNEILKLYKIIKEENTKFKAKHRQMLQQYKMQQLLSKSSKIIDFDIIKQIFQKFETQDFNNAKDEVASSPFNNLQNRGENNTMMILTNYCIYRLYCSYIKQQQQFIEEQFLRYQQYHQEQKQQLIKQFKMLQQHQQQQQTATTYQQNQQHSLHQNPQNIIRTNANVPNINNNNNIYYNDQHPNHHHHPDDDQNKPKTYAEIATIENSVQYSENNDLELISATNNFQPYKKLAAKPYLEETRKTVNLLFNPITNEHNQIYYFNFERNSQPFGRVLIKVFSDIAPKMSYNFHALTTHEKGFGYSGCKVFECHPNESIITGDIEQNTGYSSRSIYEDVQFVPDDTNIAPFAGAVGMRRAKKKFDSQGLVGSQFRIILTELGFTAIFGCVIEGLDVVKKISQTIVQNDKIHGTNTTTSTTPGGGGGGGGVGAGGGVNGSNGTVTGIATGNAVGGIFIAQCGLYEFMKRDILGGI